MRRQFVLAAAMVGGVLPAGSAVAIDRDPSGNKACVVEWHLPTPVESCTGAFDVQYYYSNPKAKTISDNPPEFVNTMYDGHYIAQSSSTNCYAAALEMAFQALGTSYEQSKFSQSIGHACLGAGHMPLTFSQIVFAITKVHLTSGGVWYIDPQEGYLTKQFNSLGSQTPPTVAHQSIAVSSRIELHRTQICRGWDGELQQSSGWSVSVDLGGLIAGALAPRQTTTITTNGRTQSISRPMTLFNSQPQTAPIQAEQQYFLAIDPYRPVLWSHPGPQGSGGVVPIRHAGDLLNQFKRGVPILAGLNSSDFSHVVLVRRIRYTGSPDTDGNFDENIHIDAVEVIDPSGKPKPVHWYTGDDFMASSRMLFAIYDPR